MRRSASERPVCGGPARRDSSGWHGTAHRRATARASSSAWSKPRWRRRAAVVGAQVTIVPGRRRDERGHARGQPPERRPVAPVLEVGDERPADALVGEQRPARVEPGRHGARPGDGRGRRRTPSHGAGPRRTAPGAPHRAAACAGTWRRPYGRGVTPTGRGVSGQATARDHILAEPSGPANGPWHPAGPLPSVCAVPLLRPVVEPRRRVPRLVAGLVLCGLGIAFMVAADLGLAPWSVLDQGISAAHRHPDRHRQHHRRRRRARRLAARCASGPGLGTVLNVVLIGTTIDLALLVLDTPDSLAGRARLPGVRRVPVGPRHRPLHRRRPRPRAARRADDRAGRPRRRVDPPRAHRHRADRPRHRAGCSAGRSASARVAFAVTIGPLVQFFLPRLTVGDARSSDGRRRRRRPAVRSARGAARRRGLTATGRRAWPTPDSPAAAAARISAWPAQITRNVATTATGAHRHDSVSTTRSSVPIGSVTGSQLLSRATRPSTTPTAHSGVERHLGERAPARPGRRPRGTGAPR